MWRQYSESQRSSGARRLPVTNGAVEQLSRALGAHGSHSRLPPMLAGATPTRSTLFSTRVTLPLHARNPTDSPGTSSSPPCSLLIALSTRLLLHSYTYHTHFIVYPVYPYCPSLVTPALQAPQGVHTYNYARSSLVTAKVRGPETSGQRVDKHPPTVVLTPGQGRELPALATRAPR